MGQSQWEYYTPAYDTKTGYPVAEWAISTDVPTDPSHPAAIRIRAGAKAEEITKALEKVAKRVRWGSRAGEQGDVAYCAQDWCSLDRLADCVDALASSFARREGAK